MSRMYFLMDIICIYIYIYLISSLIYIYINIFNLRWIWKLHLLGSMKTEKKLQYTCNSKSVIKEM